MRIYITASEIPKTPVYTFMCRPPFATFEFINHDGVRQLISRLNSEPALSVTSNNAFVVLKSKLLTFHNMMLPSKSVSEKIYMRSNLNEIVKYLAVRTADYYSGGEYEMKVGTAKKGSFEKLQNDVCIREILF